MVNALKQHWPEYLMEAMELGIFMVSACLFGALLEYPGSPARQALPDPLLRRALGGMAMGLTAVGVIYSPWGKQSGAHFNPSVTLTFWRLGKVAGADAFFLRYFSVCRRCYWRDVGRGSFAKRPGASAGKLCGHAPW